jgi:hypothetical protein
MVNPKGVKNSAGGEEPERSSPTAGARRNRTRAGGGLIRGNLNYSPPMRL